MEFNKNLDWFKESDEDDNLLADDELDMVEEEMNEGLYVDPSNYDKHNDLVDVVDKAGNPQKMTQATYDKNKDSGEFEKKQEEPKDTSSKEAAKQTEVLPVDPKKYPVLANKVDKVDPELQKVSDNLYEDFYNKNTSKEAARGLKENLLNKFKDYDDNEIASSLLNLPTIGKQSLAIDALDSLAYLDVKNPNNFSKDDKRLYDISRLASEMYYQQSQYNKDAINHEKSSYWANKGVATNNKGMVKASSFSNIKQKDLDERLAKEKQVLVADGSRLFGIEKDNRDSNKYYIGTVNKEGYTKAVIGNYSFEDLKSLLSNKKDISDKANKATLDRIASFSKDR